MFQTLGIKRVLLPGVCSALLLSGCGGSSSSVSTDGNVQGPATTDGFVGDDATLKTGAFLADVARKDGASGEGLMLLSTTGKFAIVFDADAITFGSLALAGTRIEGSGSDYVLDRNDAAPKWERASGEFRGKVTSNESASFETIGGGITVGIERDNASSDQSLGLSDLKGIYTMTGPNPSTSIIINEGGVVEGSAGECMFSDGQVTIPDSSINIFEIAYTASNCEDLADGTATGSQRNGDYSGVGTFIPAADSVGMGDIQFAANNGKIAFSFIGTDGL